MFHVLRLFNRGEPCSSTSPLTYKIVPALKKMDRLSPAARVVPAPDILQFESRADPFEELDA